MKLIRANGDGRFAGLNPYINRRNFLRAAGLGGLGAGVYALSGPALVEEVEAQGKAPVPPKLDQHKTICTNCAVGCGFIGETKDGVWVSQEPWFEHPINLGSLCSKGMAAREKVSSEKRLRYPMKLEGGKWKRISWDQAMTEITAKIQEIRKQHGPDALMILGSAHHNNETAYALRKFAALWGSNNLDHQARICHSTTVAGLANVWGYGVMTNHMNDIRNSRSILLIGENPSESHPISMQHILTAKEVNRAVIIAADPRFSKSVAFATKHIQLRSGTDVAFIYGLCNVILANGWEDKKMINDRTYGFPEWREVVKQYDPDTVANVCGIKKEDIHWAAKAMADNRPGTVIWAMGGTQHSNGTSVTRSYCTLQLILGNMGKPGGGANVFRGHDNVQGATDLGVLSDTLPGYYGLGASAWKHWANVWDVDLDWLKGRFKDEKLMQKAGFTVARWYEGVLMDANKELSNGGVNIHGVLYWGHSTNCESQLDRIKRALDKVELLVDIDPFVTSTSTLPDRKDGVYILPAASNYEQWGSVTNTNDDIQYRNRIVPPVWESRTDMAIMLDFAERLGFKDKLIHSKRGDWRGLPKSAKDLKELSEQSVNDIQREWNLGMLSVGMRGQTPERIKLHYEWAYAFNVKTKRAEGGPVNGDYWCLPWPCWNEKHPGTPIKWSSEIPVMEGGLPFRVRWGEKSPDGRNMLAANGSAPPGGSINGGYPPAKDFATDLTGKAIDDYLAKGLSPIGNGRARFNAWNIPDPIPLHHEPIHSPRPDLITKYPTYDDVKDQFRVPTLFKSLQKPEWVKDFPIILTSGRQVEFEGGGWAERNEWWLVELQPEMYAEIHPKLANDHGIRHGDWMWIESPKDLDDAPSRVKVKAKVTKRVGPDTIFLPFHWGGVLSGTSYVNKFPAGNAPYAIGESANTITNYGYDRVTQMQETKTGLCRIKKA
jgi:formate dehydrogenase major subunit